MLVFKAGERWWENLVLTYEGLVQLGWSRHELNPRAVSTPQAAIIAIKTWI
jgi:hypothetical protein